MRPVCLSVVLALAVASATAGAAEPRPEPSSVAESPVLDGVADKNAVETLLVEWTDLARQRIVPVKIYYPKQGAGPSPVILFSHGLGSSRHRYAYLGEHWARHGYVSVHMQHQGSDENVYKGTLFIRRALLRAANNPRASLDRPPDISFVLDRLAEVNHADSPLRGRLDLERVGMAGHSFGGFATLAVAGQIFRNAEGNELKLVDRRIKAAFIMSPSAPFKRLQPEDTFDRIAIPCLHMTATEDESPLGLTTKADRRAAFDGIKKADQYLITFQGGDHAIFTDQKRPFGNGDKDELFRELIQVSSTAFWDAYLKEDRKARLWLADGGLAARLAADGVLEKKLVSP